MDAGKRTIRGELDNWFDDYVDQRLLDNAAVAFEKLFAEKSQQEIAKASSDITANQLLNHIADGMRYDETFTYTELEEALKTLKNIRRITNE